MPKITYTETKKKHKITKPKEENKKNTNLQNPKSKTKV